MLHPKKSKFLQFDCNQDNLQYFHSISGVVTVNLILSTQSANTSQRNALFLNFFYFGKELYMFRTDLMSIIRSLNTVFTATGICHIIYVILTVC
jgi:hypothetical protein